MAWLLHMDTQDTGAIRMYPCPFVFIRGSLQDRAQACPHKSEGDPCGSPSGNSPELVYFSFWTMALKASASL